MVPCRPGFLVEPEGCGLGKGFNPHIVAVDALVKKLERRKAAWQKQPLDIDATINQVMHPMGNFTDHADVIIEDDDDDEPPEGLLHGLGCTELVSNACFPALTSTCRDGCADASCDDVAANTSSADKPVRTLDSHSELPDELQHYSQAEVDESGHVGKSIVSADADDKIDKQDRAETSAMVDPVHAVCNAAPCDGGVGEEQDSGVNPTQKTYRLEEDPVVVPLNTTPSGATGVVVENFRSTEGDLTNTDGGWQARGGQAASSCPHHDQEFQQHCRHAPGDIHMYGLDILPKCL